MRPPSKGAAPAGGPPPFGIVLPFRDTPRERRFAERSVPSAIALGPDELIVGIDGGAGAGEAARFVESLCERHALAGRLSIVRAERSAGWKFQLAHVIWSCYTASSSDNVLVFDVDSVLRRSALRGAGMVGRDGAAVVSMSKRILTRTPSEYIRHASIRLRALAGANAFAGTYWVHLPYYFASVTREGLAGISNGIDDYMVSSIRAGGAHRVVALAEIGSDSLDVQNPDYPWRQFADGVWHGANGSVRRAGLRGAARAAALVAVKAAAYQRPHLLRGWRWALSHQDSEACRAARGSTFVEWVTVHGSAHVRNLRGWDRRGTGF